MIRVRAEKFLQKPFCLRLNKSNSVLNRKLIMFITGEIYKICLDTVNIVFSYSLFYVFLQYKRNFI